MQRLVSLFRMASAIKPDVLNKTLRVPSFFSTFHSPLVRESLLLTKTPIFSQVCSFKVKGRVKRRCKDCYVVVRDERTYVICPKFPRHKQMSMKPKPHNTWILTQASQSRVRPW